MTTLDHEPDDQTEAGLPIQAGLGTLNNSTTTPEIGDLRNEALRRKERLIRLRKQARGETSTQSTDSTESGDLPKPIFRNYRPVSDVLKPGQLPDSSMVNLDVHVSEQLEAAKAQAVVDEVNLFNLAPRKPDWDLKRGVEKKLRKLERRTQRVIAELIRERLKNSESNLDVAVNQQPTPFTRTKN
ncbi:unnamed protein product [Schistocephalus solidus]|uniref:Coiled-coil domain-containing protein 12 n=2 Tax=Schistocephalus solidus TaxID=70667 RepID=A0A0X3NYH1_SCHSO|nr:unnamed protein product [Schistocephalus solidus]